MHLYRAPGELDVFFTNDSGVPFDCFRWGSGAGHVVCHAESGAVRVVTVRVS